MVYIEHHTAEPVIAHGNTPTTPTGAHKRGHSPLVRWFVMGCLAAIVVYVGVVYLGWQAVVVFFHSLSL